MSNFTVTAIGKAAIMSSVTLTSDTIRLTDGTFDIAWTMQATHNGAAPLDDEGWCPWSGFDNDIQTLLVKGYIVEVPDAS